MESMQVFYQQLVAANCTPGSYQSYLCKLTQLRLDQLTMLKSLFWWNGWASQEA